MTELEELEKAVEDALGVYHTALGVFHTAHAALIATVDARDDARRTNEYERRTG